MKHRIRWFLVAFCMSCCWLSAPVEALSVIPQVPDLPASPVMIVGYQNVANMPGFVQLYNNSSSIVSMKNWKLEYDIAGVRVPVELQGWMLPRQSAVVSEGEFVSGSDSVFTLPADMPHDSLTGLRLVPPDTYSPYVVGGNLSTSERYELSKSSAGNYTASSKFEVVAADAVLVGGGLYSYPETSPLRIVEILANARDCGPLENSADCYEFIKLYNPTDEIVDMSRYRLRVGYANQTSGITNTVALAGGIEAHSYYAVANRNDGKPLEMTASGGNVWLEDTYGLTAYQETAVAYRDIGQSAHKGQSWALDGNIWKWAVASPTGANNFDVPLLENNVAVKTLKPCRSDQYRSVETNRCRNLATTTRTPCRADQYRSAETNRCRNLTTAAGSSLKPCAPNQQRNPATNRCRTIGTAASQLTPCKENQERNPDTNRCRNVTGSAPAAAFAVEEIADTGKAFAGWWALGGIGLLAVGYGVWEWRAEIRSAISKVIEYFPGRK